MQEALSKIVLQRRKASGLSQQELAARIGVARTYLADIERGARNISLASLVKLARGLDMPVSKLIHLAEVHDKQEEVSSPKAPSRKEPAESH